MDKYRTTFETWNKIAQLYQDKFMDLDLYDDTYDFFCTLVGESASSLLEIGCGPGNVTKYLRAKLPKIKIHGIDVAPKMIELAKGNNPSASFEVMDAREIHLLEAKYDAIFCGFCLPYLSKEDIAKLISDASELLSVEGYMYLSCIEGAYEASAFQTGSSGDQAFVYYHDEEQLQVVLEMNCFEVTKVYRKIYERGEDEEVHLILLAQKKY